MKQHLGLASVLIGAAASCAVGACSDDFADCEALRNCASGGSGAGGSSAAAGQTGEAGQGSPPAGGSSASAGAAGSGEGAAAGHAGESGQGGGDGGAGGADESGGAGGASDSAAGGASGAGNAGGEGGTPVAGPVECGATPVVGCFPSALGSVYVNAAAAPDGDGSQAAPFQTIAAALALVAKKQASRVLVCSAIYPESVSLTPAHAGVSLLGGFNCGDWHYSPLEATQVAPDVAGFALELQKVSGATIGDLLFIARSATAAGASSIAAFINESTAVQLARVTLRAGAAQDGAAGVFKPLANWPTAAQLAGNPGKGSSNDLAEYTGGEAKQGICPGGDATWGGRGGSHPLEQLAEPGEPAGRGGVGSSAPINGCDAIDPTNEWVCVCVQTAAANGKIGLTGAPGVGAAAGGVLVAAGFLSNAGGGGGVGSPGGGGGGGDGAWAASYNLEAWLGGGSGGAGGCGGNGAMGGNGGGASIALVVRSSTAVSLMSSSFISGNAGNGGAGGAGQPGQAGGAGGVPVSADYSRPCVGGKGGAGGRGGSSGGGAGGVSLGIAYAGAEPIVDAASSYQLGAPGAAGLGTTATNAGAAGIAKAVLQLTAK